MIDEVLAEETQRGERRKNRCDQTTAAILEPEPAAPAAQDLRESPIEPNPNPKRRLLVKSASSTGSGSGQQSAERPAGDIESGVQTGDLLEMGTGESTTLLGASSANSRRRTVRTSSRRHARSSRRASRKNIEDRECRTGRTGQHNGDVNHVACAQMGKTIEPLWGLSLSKADGWNLKNHSHLTVARHLREKNHPSMLVVTIRDGEDRGICSAALEELLNIVKDQMEDRSVVVFALNKESAIWKNSST